MTIDYKITEIDGQIWCSCVSCRAGGYAGQSIRHTSRCDHSARRTTSSPVAPVAPVALVAPVAPVAPVTTEATERDRAQAVRCGARSASWGMNRDAD